MYCLIFACLIVSTSCFTLWDVFMGGVGGLVGIADLTSVGPQDAKLNISQLANKYGYPLETHTVITDDDYILSIHRMPHGRIAHRNATNAPVVFLMHGLWESSDSWLLQGPHKSLAYILADAGYDVWIGNARGNRYTLNHKTLNSKSSEYWAFSWEEIGVYDLPAMIDYALDYTCKKSLYYVGFSQGTTTYFVMNSMKPEYNKKIKLMFALAPEVFLGNARSVILNIFSPAHSYLGYILKNYNIYSPSTSLFRQVLSIMCKLLTLGCENLFVSVFGQHHVNSSLFPVILGHVPTGSSTLQFIHYGQLKNSERFCRYDFGVTENIKRYGRRSPPDYNLSAVTSSVILFYSDSDLFSDSIDVMILISKLSNVKASYFVSTFTHLDFMYADAAALLIYSNILAQMNNRERILLDYDENIKIVFTENNII